MKKSPIEEIEWKRSTDREYAIFKNYDHFIACTDTNLGYNKLATLSKCSTNQNTYSEATGGSESSWRYGSEKHKDYIKRTSERIAEPKTLALSKKNLKEHLNSRDVIALQKRMMSEKKRRRFNETQGVMSIPRILTGNIDYFSIRKKKKIVGIKIGIKGTLTCNFEESAFVNMISSLIITVRMLEFIGIPVELHYIADAQGLSRSRDYSRQGIVFPLKLGGERMNLNKICMIGGPGHFRHHVFAAWALHLTGERSDGLGRQTDTEYDVDAKLLHFDVILGKEFMDNNPTDIFNFVTKQIFKS